MIDQPAASVTTASRQELYLAATLKRFIQLGILAILSTIGVYAWVYYEQRAWQTGVVVGGLVLGLVCLGLANLTLRRQSGGPERLATGSFWVLMTVWCAYTAGEMSWLSLTPYHAVGGVLLFFLIGNTLSVRRLGIKRRLPQWVGFSIPFIAAILLINRFYPFVRYDSSLSLLLSIYIPGVTTFLGLFSLYYLLRGALSGNLRVRLIVAFSLLATVPILAIGTMSIMLDAQRTQQDFISKLESVANLKEAELDAWTETLRFTLFVGLPPDDQFEQVRTLAYAENPLEMPFTRMSYDNIREQYKAIIADSGSFDEMFLLDREGRVLLSTDQKHEKVNDSSEPFFRTAAGRYLVSSPYYSPRLGKLTIVAATPVKDVNGNTIGILAGRANLAHLNETMLERAGLGVTGETYLLDREGTLLTESRFPGYFPGEAKIDSPALLEALRLGQGGAGVYTSYRGVRQIGVYRWVSGLQTLLVAEQTQQEALTETGQQLLIYLGIIPLVLLAAVAAALMITRSVANPLASLAETTAQVAAGNLDLQVPIDREDEIGALARAFNKMAIRLRELIGGLEQRVAERTIDLERRTRQMRASAEVARDITQVNLSEGAGLEGLLNRAVTLISERFGYYHAGIFLLDDRSEYAVLRAANGETGRQMLARGHRLGVHGEQSEGVVGYVADTGLPRISLDVGADAVHFRNPLLPNTRSEMALPLHAGNRITGVLDVQSTDEAAFSQDDITALQTMADQLAVAIENARLVQQSKQAVAEMEKAYGRYTRQSWIDSLRQAEGTASVRYQQMDIVPAGDLRAEAATALREGRTVVTKGEAGARGSEEAGITALAVPLKLRDQVLGVLNLRYKTSEISNETIQMVEAAANRLALVLENTRLLEESRRRAVQEVVVRESTTRMRETLDVETVLRTAVDELYSVLGLESMEIRLAAPPEEAALPEPQTELAADETRLEAGG